MSAVYLDTVETGFLSADGSLNETVDDTVDILIVHCSGMALRPDGLRTGSYGVKARVSGSRSSVTELCEDRGAFIVDSIGEDPVGVNEAVVSHGQLFCMRHSFREDPFVLHYHQAGAAGSLPVVFRHLLIRCAVNGAGGIAGSLHYAVPEGKCVHCDRFSDKHVNSFLQMEKQICGPVPCKSFRVFLCPI